MPGEKDALSIRDAMRWDGLLEVAPLLVSTLERDDLLRWILATALRVVDAEACTLALNNLHTGELEYAVVLGPKSDEVRRFPVRPGEGIIGWVAEHGKPVVAPDVAQHPQWKRSVAEKIGFPTHSIVCVPLETKEFVLGALEVLNKRGAAPFTEEDAEILSAFAAIAAVAVENARLYDWLSRHPGEAGGELLTLNRELARRKAELDAVISTMGDGLVILDSGGRVVEINPTAEHLLGLRRAEVMAIGFQHSPLAECPLCPVLDAVALDPSAARREWTLSLKEGRTAACRVSLLVDNTGTQFGVAVVLSDITTLVDLNRLKSDFVAYASHELKTPLACVRGFSEALLPPDGDDLSSTERLDFLRIIHAESERAIRLITNLLDVARIEAGSALELAPEPIDLGELARRAIGASQPARAGSAPRPAFDLVVEGDVPTVVADPDKTLEVLLNLLSNAVKYSPVGSTVQVRVVPEAEGVRVSVSDEGIGLAPDQVSRLFGRYQRLRVSSSRTPGSGLGLYLSKAIVEAHGGRIWVESAAGEGSTFSFLLPYRPPTT